MNTQDLIEHFGSQAAAARALGVERQVVNNWCERGRVPWRRQLQLERITNGALSHAPEDIPEDMRIIVHGKQIAA